MNRPPAGVRAVLLAQRAALDKVVPDRRRALMGIAEDVQRQLEQRLQRLSGSPERYQTQEVRVLLAQVREVVDTLGAEFGVRVGGELEALGREAAGIGRESLLAEIDAWADKFQGSVRRVAPVELAGELLGPGLLEYYDVSRSTYGMDAIRKMRQSLAASSLSGETVWVATQKLSQKLDMPEWRAERIVRTEQSFAMHARQMDDLQTAYGPGAPGWKKQLVAVHDDRTGDDSIFVDGQTRALGEPFEDNEGRSYQHPPNRPNDREVVVFVPDEFLASTPQQAPRNQDEIFASMESAARSLLADPSDAAAQEAMRFGARDLMGLPGRGRAGDSRLELDDVRGRSTSPARAYCDVSTGKVSYLPPGADELVRGRGVLAEIVDDVNGSRERAITTLVHEESHAQIPAFTRETKNNPLRRLLEEATTEEYAQWVYRSWSNTYLRERAEQVAANEFYRRGDRIVRTRVVDGKAVYEAATEADVETFKRRWMSDVNEHGSYSAERQALRSAVQNAARDVGVLIEDYEVADWIGGRRDEMFDRDDWGPLDIHERLAKDAVIRGVKVESALLRRLEEVETWQAR